MRHKTPNIIQIDKGSAGFSVQSNSPNDTLQAKLVRAGAAWITDLQLEFDSYVKENSKYTFVMPTEFWAFNVGMYDVDVFSGCEFIQKIRLQYMQQTEAVRSVEVEQLTGSCTEKADANCDPVVQCATSPCNTPDFCSKEYTQLGDCTGEASPSSDSTALTKFIINYSDVATNEDVTNYLDDLTEELDNMLDSGYYYNNQQPISAELRRAVQDLKDVIALHEEQGGEEVPIAASTMLMQTELKKLSSQISRNMKTADKDTLRPDVPVIRPKPVKRIVASPSQVLADKINEAFKNG